MAIGRDRVTTLIVLAVALGACTADSASPPSAASRAPSAGVPSRSPARAVADLECERTRARRPRTRPAAPAFDATGLRLRLEPIADGLDRPLGVVNAGDGSNRLFVVSQAGEIVIVQRGRVLRRPFLDLSDRTAARFEQGLLGLAFHPAFEENGRFFVNFTDGAGDTVIAEYHADPSSNVADGRVVRRIMKIDQPFVDHNGGDLHFGPDGYLYIATGDGGYVPDQVEPAQGGDPYNHAQRLNSLLGKILRIDVDHACAGKSYATPTDNPFVGERRARPEIWHYGLRNPWRFSFDERTGDMWIGDVGQAEVEEIDYAPAGRGGLDFGWRRLEGTACYRPRSGCERPGDVAPVFEYSHEEGCSVTGGHVYRGKRAQMRGGYFFADYCSGTIWAMNAADPQAAVAVPVYEGDVLDSFSSFGLGEDGELYIVRADSGELLRVVPRR